MKWVIPCILLGLCSCSTTTHESDSGGQTPGPTNPDLEKIDLPAGFVISEFASDVEGARSLEATPSGTVFVGSRDPGVVYALVDEDGDHVADRKLIIDENLTSPNGVTFHEGALYVAERSRILRYDDIENRLENPPDPVVVYDEFPTESHHGWKFIDIGPDGKLYVPVGAPCNICDEGDPFASITRMNLDGTGFEIFARGIRNSVGFAWHPETGELWFTDNGRDHFGDDRPPDELNRAPEPGMHFGYPYVHGTDLLDDEFGQDADPADYTPPMQELGPHVASLGMEFYEGDQFPAEYRHQIFIAEHGSWNRSDKIGYRVSLVRLDEAGQPTSYAPFASGWLESDGDVWGRPVDLEHLEDGSLLVSDDEADAVYRIAYTGS